MIDHEIYNTGCIYELKAIINYPTKNHFNCFLFNPKLKETVYDGWFLHGGMRHDGNLVKENSLQDLYLYHPCILFYQKKLST